MTAILNQVLGREFASTIELDRVHQVGRGEVIGADSLGMYYVDCIIIR